MRNTHKWTPTRIVKDPRTGKFVTNQKAVYGGSQYIAELQHTMYIPLIERYIHGRVLDVGCGPVPYYELYKPRVSENICVDWGNSPHAKEMLDHFVDLNASAPLPFANAEFDTIMASDMIVHITRPHLFLAELNRVLKPGGTVFISSPFVYWMGEYPHEYMHFSEFALKHIAADAGFETVHIEAYGGRADVLMDTLNKFMAQGFSNRIFRVFAKLALATGWPQRDRERTKGPYAQGYAMVIRKPA
jgi:SAM-dependent methyltransferase